MTDDVELDVELLVTCSGARHWFDVGWTGIEGESSLLFCHACGELRPMAMPTIEAPAIESLSVQAKDQ